jgi:hypothetical protein
MPAPVLQFKRGNAGVAGTVPALRPGEPAISLNNFDFFIGIDTSVANNKFFGSHRYWGREDGTNSLKLKLVDKDGTNGIHIKSPNTLSGIGTYILPDTSTIQNGYFLKVSTDGTLSWESVSADAIFSDSTLSGVTTITGSLNNQSNTVNSGITTFTNSTFIGNLNISGIATIGSGVGVTQFSSTVGAGTSTSSVPTSFAVINYVAGQIANIDISIAADTGTGSVNQDTQTLTIDGTAGEIETSASEQTITIGLPDAVIVGTSLSAPTIKTDTIQHRNGTQAATIDSSGNITASQNLTVSGDLFVNGSTTQINTSSMLVEDRVIELGLVDAGAPGSATTWDLGVLFNYNSSGPKKSAFVWEHSNARFKFASQVTETGGNDNDSPQITFAAYAPIEVSALWINDCAGQSQVISCSGSERKLENITIDAGTF